MDSIKLPETPVMVAGGLGGPAVMFFVTPARNGLTLGATNPQASALSLYRQVFRGGGWTGGIYPAIAACPQFLCLGPAYHVYHSFAGTAGAVFLAGMTESAIIYGAETCNAQMATNAKAPGTFANVHPSWKPFGPGLSINVARNVLAVAGLRLFCTPCTWAAEKISGKSNAGTQLAGDFAGNVMGACLTAPVHQIYNFTVTTPEIATLSGGEKMARMQQFLKDQYTVNGRISSVVPRDLFMRSMYVAVAYTLYSTLERTLVKMWPK